MRSTDLGTQKPTPDTQMVILTNVTPINLIKREEEKIKDSGNLVQAQQGRKPGTCPAQVTVMLTARNRPRKAPTV